MDERYGLFSRLLIDRPHPRVLRVVMNRPEKLNAADGEMHALARRSRTPASLVYRPAPLIVRGPRSFGSPSATHVTSTSYATSAFSIQERLAAARAQSNRCRIGFVAHRGATGKRSRNTLSST